MPVRTQLLTRRDPGTRTDSQGFACSRAGEANSRHPDEYLCQQKAMIREWRAQFHRESLEQTRDDFPFGYVQVTSLSHTHTHLYTHSPVSENVSATSNDTIV